MLDGDNVVGRFEERSNDSGGVETLLDIEVRRRFVEHVAVRFKNSVRFLNGDRERERVGHLHISILNASHTDSEPLQLSSRQLTNLTLHNDIQIQSIDDFINVGQLLLRFQHLSNSLFSLDRSRNVIDVLRFDERFNVVFENFGEVVLKFGTTEVFEDILPIGRRLHDHV